MIEIDGIVKKFGHQVVLDQLSLSVERGELFVLLGVNGSGKTTLFRCLAGLYRPIAGTIRVDRLDRWQDHLAIRRFTAFLESDPHLPPNLSCRAWLATVADVYGVPAASREGQIADLLDVFHLAEVAGKRLQTCSSGQRKKLAVAAALVTNARLFIFDEPFTGEIDPPGIAALKQILRGLRDHPDLTVVMATQLADLVEGLASRVGVLHDGRIAASGTVEELKTRYRADSLEEVLAAVTCRRSTRSVDAFLGSLAR